MNRGACSRCFARRPIGKPEGDKEVPARNHHFVPQAYLGGFSTRNPKGQDESLLRTV